MSLKKGDEVIVVSLDTEPDKPGVVVDPVPNQYQCIKVNRLESVAPDGHESYKVSSFHRHRVIKKRIRRMNPASELQVNTIRHLALACVERGGPLYNDMIRRAAGKFMAPEELSERQANTLIELYKLVNKPKERIANPNKAFKRAKRNKEL